MFTVPSKAILLVLLCFCLAADAQDSTFKVSLVSPTAAQLGKYGDIPVNYNTGIPNISIPIYTVKSGKLSMPISLSYHASGLKVQEQASWVGAGWSLNAGGVITRTVIGEPDDRGYASFNNVTNGHYSDYGFNNYLFIPGSGFGETSDGMVADDIDFIRGYRDGQPDLYFFNFGGYTGKFYFNDDRTPIFVPEQDFKVHTDFTLGPGFTGFVITTPDGTSYYFGNSGNTGSVSPIEVSNPSTAQTGPSNATLAATAWYLNKIVSADGMDSIKLTYAQETYSDYTLSFFPAPMLNFPAPNYLTSGAIAGYNLVKNFISGVRLTQVAFANGTVTLTPSASPRQDLTGSLTSNSGMYDAPNTYSTNNAYPSYSLGSIQISDNNGFCKKDSLFYGYFYDASALNATLLDLALNANIHSDQYRLRLDSLHETSCNGTAAVPSYKFAYYSEQVPRNLSFGLDHWGFSNGVTGNTVLVPTLTMQSGTTVEYVAGANRDAAWPAMRGGALQQITYPTGGTTTLAFSSNDTYMPYTKDTLEQRLYVSAGFTESSMSETKTMYFDGNIYQMILDNSIGRGNANISVSSSSGLQGAEASATAGQVAATQFFQLPAGTYTVTINFVINGQWTSGYGAQANIQEWYPQQESGNILVGGLRIDTITNYDGMSTANNVQTIFNYYAGSQSSGVLYSRPVYCQNFRNDEYATVWNTCGAQYGCAGTGNTYYISPGSIEPMATVQGNHIGYNQVTVTQPGNGSTLYYYYGSQAWDNNYSDVCTRYILVNGCSISTPNYPPAPLPFDFMRGELKYEAKIDASGHYLHDEWHFPRFVMDTVITPGYIGLLQPYFTGTVYNMQSAYRIKDSTVATDYDNSTGQYVTKISSTSYGSRFHHEPTRSVTTTSTGDSLVTNTHYSMDFRIPACDNLVDSNAYYIAQTQADTSSFNTLLISCTPQNCNMGNSSSQTDCRYTNFQQFRRNLALARIAYVNRRLAYLNSVATNFSTAEASADTLLLPIMRLRDEYCIAPVEVSQWRDNYLKNADFTQYTLAASPGGVSYPQKTRLVNLAAPSSSFSSAAVSGSSISMDSRYLDESFYKFGTGNPLQMTPHNGVVQSYIWDYQNKEPIAKVANATVDQIAYTSFEADGNGSWTIPSGVRAGSGITGSSCYSLSNGSVSRVGLTSTTTYVVSYWSSTGASYAVTGSTAVTQGKTITINGSPWTYFEHKVSGISSVTVSGSGNIDELRLYPANAQMLTYTYSPLLGMTSECDVTNRITYYSYDALGRLNVVKDQDGNIIKTVNYHYKNQ